MRGYQAGDKAAFQALFARHARRIFGFLCHRTGSRVLAEDLTQQTWLQVHRARHSFRGDGRFAPWLYTIAANLGRTRARKEGRELLTADGETPEGTAEPGLTEDQRAVRQALLAIPEGNREVILLHRWHGLGFAEIAEVLGASESAVKVRAHRGYLLLRGLLSGAETGGAGPREEER